MNQWQKEWKLGSGWVYVCPNCGKEHDMEYLWCMSCNNLNKSLTLGTKEGQRMGFVSENFPEISFIDNSTVDEVLNQMILDYQMLEQLMEEMLPQLMVTQ